MALAVESTAKNLTPNISLRDGTDHQSAY